MILPFEHGLVGRVRYTNEFGGNHGAAVTAGVLVPGGLSLEELSAHRARYLASTPWTGTYDEVSADLARRDSMLKRFKLCDEVVLWFEHDLYDQLQLLQILHWFSLRDLGATSLGMICIDSYPGVEPFHGLGQLDSSQLAGLFPARRAVGRPELELARRGWEAFTADEPGELQRLVDDGCPALPFLGAALARMLEQYPSTRDGLSRTERQVLQSLKDGELGLRELFRASQLDLEERPFMGDAIFVVHVAVLGDGPRPLLRMVDDEPVVGPGDAADDRAYWERAVRLTDDGRKVLAGQVDRTRYQTFDRWLGGVHLEGAAHWAAPRRTGRDLRTRRTGRCRSRAGMSCSPATPSRSGA